MTQPASASDAAFAEAHRRLLADDSIQFELAPRPEPQTPEWLKSVFEFVGRHSDFFWVLGWVVLGALALFLLWALARRFTGADWPWRRTPEEEEAPSWRPEEAAARRLLEEADRLAAEGRFGESVHLLLFRSIEELDERRPDLVRPASTGRDLAAHPRIPAGPREALERIVRTVERGLFARRPLGAEDWSDCRAAYERFAFAGTWEG